MLTAFAGGTLFGERSADAPKVLALHGWRGDSSQLAAAVQDFPAIRLDLPGFGKTPAPENAMGAEGYARAIEAVLDEFDAPPVIVGYSFGGRVAVNMAAMWPERVSGLVLTGVPLIRRTTAKKPPLAFRLAKAANKAGLLSDRRMEAERRKRGSADYKAATGVMRDVLVMTINESYEAQLRRITCHVELVWGDADTEAPLRNAVEAQELLTDSQLTVVTGGTHWSLLGEGVEVAEAVRRCLA